MRKGKEPDWGKFGLDGEKQPLNPGSSRLEHQQVQQQQQQLQPQPPQGSSTGSQVVNDNELFADDQVSTNKPEIKHSDIEPLF